MPIETKVRPSLTAKNLAVAVVCLGFGVWGWYDYAIAIPQEQADFAEFTAAEKTKSEMEALVRLAPLTEEQKSEFRAAESVLARFTEKPVAPAAYDRPVQLWVYIIGCGVLGTPYFLYAQWRLGRKRYRLDDDGTLHAPEGTFAADQMTTIDMANWMEKSIATVEMTDGTRVKLDDYEYKGVEDIVALLAARFHPGQWTSDARPIGDPKSRDTKAALAAATPAEGTDAAASAPGGVSDDAPDPEKSRG